MYIKQWLYIVVFGIGVISQAQNCEFTFYGQVLDFHNKSPLVAATIQVKNNNNYLTTNNKGQFKIENICQGELKLSISHVGCETKNINLFINNDTTQVIFLEHHIEELDEVTVTGASIKKETKTAQEQILKSSTLDRYSGLSLGDVLKEVPGISSISTGSTIVKPMVNGMHSSRVMILNNGVRLQDQEWGIEHAPNIDINSANQISVIKGAGALAFGGDAIGGIVVLKPKKVITKDTLFGQTIFGGQTNGKGYYINSRLNKNFESGWFS